jgi:hypothetical protein
VLIAAREQRPSKEKLSCNRDHMSIAWLKGTPAQNNYSVSQIFKISFCIQKSTSIEKLDSKLLKNLCIVT